MNKLLEELHTAGIESCSLDSVVDDGLVAKLVTSTMKGLSLNYAI